MNASRGGNLASVTVLIAAMLIVGVYPYSSQPSPALKAMSSTLLPFIAAAKLLGPVNPQQEIAITFMLRPDTLGLGAYVLSTGDRSSANYRRYLTQGQLMNSYGPADSAIEAVKEWIGGRELGTPALQFGDWLEVNTTVGQVESALSVPLNQYSYEGQVFYANPVDPNIPIGVSADLVEIGGLNNYVAPSKATVTMGNGLAISPADVLNYYDFMPMFRAGVNASRQTIAIMGYPGNGMDVSDVRAFWAKFKINGSTVSQVVVGGGPPPHIDTDFSDYYGGSGEMTLDAEWAGVTAPGASIVVVTSNCSNSCRPEYQQNATWEVAWESELNYIVTNVHPSIISASTGVGITWLAPQNIDNIHNLLLTAAGEGILVVGATGDDGYGNGGFGITMPAADPLTLSVGGVVDSLQASNSTGITGEAGWNRSAGGPVYNYAKPGYQSAQKIKILGGGDFRYTPDISMPAALLIAVYFDGQWMSSNGTSFAAPMIAGLMADIFQYISPDPLIAYPLYDLGYGSKPYGYEAYMDVTTGCNHPGQPLICARPGWDNVTGIGAPFAWNLTRALRNYYTGNLTYYLTMSASPSSAGSVSPGSGWYVKGSSVTISAQPNAGYVFSRWTGTGSGSYSSTANPYTITVNSNITETANFQVVYRLSMTTMPSSGGGYVTVSPLGIGGGNWYASGTVVTITAYPNYDGGYTFGRWTGSGSVSYNGQNLQAQVTMNSNIYETAYFQRSGGAGCVLQGTMITLANGTRVPVQNLKTGESILSYDTSSHRLATTTVSNDTAIHVSQVVSINNGALYASGLADQPIYVRMLNGTQRMLPLGELSAGIKLFQPVSNAWVAVTSIKIMSGSFTVYDVRTSDGNPYVANNFIPSPK